MSILPSIVDRSSLRLYEYLQSSTAAVVPIYSVLVFCARNLSI